MDFGYYVEFVLRPALELLNNESTLIAQIRHTPLTPLLTPVPNFLTNLQPKPPLLLPNNMMMRGQLHTKYQHLVFTYMLLPFIQNFYFVTLVLVYTIGIVYAAFFVQQF